MVLVISILIMAGLTAVNYRVARSLLYPAALLTAAWTVLFVLLLAAGSIFYPISVETLTVYLVGAAAFSVGAILPSVFFPQAFEGARPRVGRRPGGLILTGGLILLVVTLPFYWDFIQTQASPSSPDDFWFSVRSESVDLGDDWSAKSLGALFFEGLAVLASLLAVTAVAEGSGSRLSRIRTMLIIAMALPYALLQAASSGAVMLALGLAGAHAVRNRKLRMKTAAIAVIMAIASFSIISVALSKGKTHIDAPLSENLAGVAELVGVYVLGGVVAFDTVVQYPASVPPVWNIWRVFLLTANKFGAGFDVPAHHAQFTDISDDWEGNVYSIYFAYYPDYGLVGVGIIMLVLGVILTFIYQNAIRGNPRSIVLYASVFSGILLSGFSEYFFLNANFWFKAILYTLAVYGIQTSSPAREALRAASPLALQER